MQAVRQYRQLRRDLQGRFVDFQKALGERSNISLKKSHIEEFALSIPGVSDATTTEGRKYFCVVVDGKDKLINPRTWTDYQKWFFTAIVSSTSMLVSGSSAIDSLVLKQATDEFHTSAVTESLAGTGIFLIGFGFGSLFSGPFSETIGRSPVYILSLMLFLIFVMASGLSTGVATQLVFRLLSGFFGCTPLTTFGGSVSDMWNQIEKAIVFPICVCMSFLAPFLAPMISAYIGQSSLISWRWTEWITLIFGALVISSIGLLVPETYAPIMASWKASHLRCITGDDRFMSQAELYQQSLSVRLLTSVYRPFNMVLGELMVAVFTAYMSVIYIVLFTFLTGYDFIYGRIYGFSQGQVGLTFIGMNIGFLIALASTFPLYQRYKRVARESAPNSVLPEERLWYAILGAPWLPISLFWMAWTSFPSISYWSPLAASVPFGYSVQGIYITSYQYIIDAYEQHAASALVALTFARYVAAGGMVVVSTPMYENLGVHWTLTVLGCISLVMTPIPYVFYWRGLRNARRQHSAPTIA